MKAYSSLVLAIVALAGCVSSSLPEGYVGASATIKDSAEIQGYSKSHFFIVSEVNGRSIETSEGRTRRANQGNGFNMYPEVISRPIPVGKVELEITGEVVYAADILAIVGKSYRVSGSVTIDATANTEYVVTGVLREGERAVWIKEAKSGRIVSTIVSKKK